MDADSRKDERLYMGWMNKYVRLKNAKKSEKSLKKGVDKGD